MTLTSAIATGPVNPESPELPDRPTEPASGNAGWNYQEAFSRNLGLVDATEQQILRRSCVALPGLGGVGGVHLATLARLGIGRFIIGDLDHFECANTNRQYGAMQSTAGRPKAEVMAEIVRDINPEAEVRIFADGVQPDRVEEFLDGADVLVDSMDLFEMNLRRKLFAQARRQGIYGITAGPVGCSTAWLLFAPEAMSFDEYFQVSDELSELEQLIAFGIGLAPKATHLKYLDLAKIDLNKRHGPSLGTACNLSAGVVGTEVMKILLKRGNIAPAPCYFQFDPYLGQLRKGRLLGGNRHPVQRFKRWWLKRKFVSPAKS